MDSAALFPTEKKFTAVFITALCLSVPTAFFAPRFMAYAPGLLAVLFLAGFCFLSRSKPRFYKPSFVLAVSVIALSGLSSLWAVEPGFSFERTMKMALVLLGGGLLPGLVLSLRAENIRACLWVLPICVAMAAILNIAELSFDMPVYRFLRGIGPGEVIGYAGANRGIFCTIAVFFCALAALRMTDISRNMRRIAAAGLSALVAVMLLLSESQSCQLGFVVAVVLFLAFPYRVRAAWAALWGILAALIAFSPWIAQGMYQYFAAKVENIAWLRAGYAAERMEIWDFVSRYALQNPFYGYGVESTRFIEFDSLTLYHPSAGVLHPHNFALQIWIEFGALGVVLALAFFAYLFYRLSALPKELAKIALPSVFIFISVGATGYGMWQGWWLGEMMLVFAFVFLIFKAAGREA